MVQIRNGSRDYGETSRFVPSVYHSVSFISSDTMNSRSMKALLVIDKVPST